MPYLNFPAFQATRRECADLDTEFAADFGAPDGLPTSGFVYADGCHIQNTNDPEAAYLLVIERSNWMTDDLEELEKILWAMHYLGECGDVMLRHDDGTLDHYVQGVCAAFNTEVDGDLWGTIFSDVAPAISEREAFDRMLAQLRPSPKAAPIAATTIWQATLDSRHFSFEAYGRTEKEAQDTLIDGLHTHANQYDIRNPGWFDEADIETRELTVGHVYRDRQEIAK